MKRLPISDFMWNYYQSHNVSFTDFQQATIIWNSSLPRLEILDALREIASTTTDEVLKEQIRERLAAEAENERIFLENDGRYFFIFVPDDENEWESRYFSTLDAAIAYGKDHSKETFQIRKEIFADKSDSEEYPFMLANLDGVCEVLDVGTCIFEAKTASAYKAGEWEDTIPDEYALQLAHYMAVTGYAGAYIAVLIGGNTFKWRFVERDEELIAMLIELEAVFWHHVQDCTPPPLDGSDACAKFLSERFPSSTPQSHIALPDTAADLLAQYDEACVQLEIITEQKQRAENLLKEMMGDNEVGTAGGRVVTWKSVTQERLDGKTLKAEHPKLCKKYTNQTSFRRFTIKAAG